jgi:hypothetical protein
MLFNSFVQKQECEVKKGNYLMQKNAPTSFSDIRTVRIGLDADPKNNLHTKSNLKLLT